MNGAQALMQGLLDEKVETIFGISGGAALPIYDALAQPEIADKILNVLTRHEQGAAHMAEGYARSSGKVGVCLATSGPGATNLVTGIADAMMDSIPMVAITGQVPSQSIGTDAFQEADILGITMPIVKHSLRPKCAADIPKMVKAAFAIARSGRPGPVLLDLPRDVSQQEMGGAYVRPEELDLRGYSITPLQDFSGADEAATLIAKAERPLLYVGGGVVNANAAEPLRELAEKLDCPVTTTLMGMDVFPSAHPLSLNMLGMHGSAYANWAVRDCDLLIGIGVRFDDRVTGNPKKFALKAKVIHLEMDPAEVGKNRRANVALLGDAKEAIQALSAACKPKTNKAWRSQIGRWREEHPLHYRENGLMKPQAIVQQLGEAVNGQAILATDVGQHQMWAAQFYPFTRPRQWLTSGGLGTMGYGLPAAIGAKFANPNEEVWLISGDGSFQMNLQELATAMLYEKPIKIALFNNFYLGMVKQWQELFYDNRYSGVHLKRMPNFELLAKAYGCEGMTVTTPEEVRPAIDRAREINDRSVLIDFHHDPAEHVYPMIPSGQSVDEMRLYPPL